MPLGFYKPPEYESRLPKHVDVPRPQAIRIIDEGFWGRSTKLQESEDAHCLFASFNLAKYFGLKLSLKDAITLHRLESDFEDINLPFGKVVALGHLLSLKGLDIEIETERKRRVAAEPLTDEVKLLLTTIMEDMVAGGDVKENVVIDEAYLVEVLDSKRIIVTVVDHNRLGRYAPPSKRIYQHMVIIGHSPGIFAVHDSHYWWGRREVDKPGENIRFIKSTDLLEAMSVGPSGEKYLLFKR